VCELLGISSNRPAVWNGSLMLFQRRGGETADNPDGWGLAWREHDTWQLHKAPEAAAHSTEFTVWAQTLSTNLLIGHVRKTNPPSANVGLNTHPFVRLCCDRTWIFAHNGKVPEVVQPQGCCHPHKSKPQGETDSEHAFYFLLDEIATVFSDASAESNPSWLQTLAKLSEDIASYGQFNFLLSDGVVLIAYGHDRLYWLQSHHEGADTVFIASEPLTEDATWEAFQAGELRVYQNGNLIGSLQTTPAWVAKVGEVNGACEQTI